MVTARLPPDFKEFLRLLQEHAVDYMLIGGYAVGYYGYVRATGDMDVWIRRSPLNAEKLVTVLKEFGFDVAKLSPDLFLEADKIVRMGLPPFRIELMSSVSGVEFDDCYAESFIDSIENVSVRLISLKHLKENKLASGRHKDLNDLEHLP